MVAADGAISKRAYYSVGSASGCAQYWGDASGLPLCIEYLVSTLPSFMYMTSMLGWLPTLLTTWQCMCWVAVLSPLIAC